MTLLLSGLLLFSLCCESPSDPLLGPGPDQELELTDLSGPYLGQTPPGATPVLFAPGFVSRDNIFEHSGAVFSPDGTEVYWAAKPTGDRLFHIYFMKMVDGRWTAPRVTAFSQSHEGNRPTFSPDGNRLYFETIRNPAGGPILVVERQGDAWSEPTALPAMINATGVERPYSITADGSLYFGRGIGDSDEVLVSRRIGGRFTQPESIGGAIDSRYMEIHGFVSPNEDYMILETTDRGAFQALAISYRSRDGTWSDPVPLDFGWARFPVVSPDGNYLFFLGRDGINWVSTSFVEERRPGSE